MKGRWKRDDGEVLETGWVCSRSSVARQDKIHRCASVVDYSIASGQKISCFGRLEAGTGGSDVRTQRRRPDLFGASLSKYRPM